MKREKELTIGDILINFAQNNFDINFEDLSNEDRENLAQACSAIANLDKENIKHYYVNSYVKDVIKIKDVVKEKELYVPIFLACLIQSKKKLKIKNDNTNILIGIFRECKFKPEEIYLFYQKFHDQFENFYGNKEISENYYLNQDLLKRLNDCAVEYFRFLKSEAAGPNIRPIFIHIVPFLVKAFMGLLIFLVGLTAYLWFGGGIASFAMLAGGTLLFLSGLIVSGWQFKRQLWFENIKLIDIVWFKKEDKNMTLDNLNTLVESVKRKANTLPSHEAIGSHEGKSQYNPLFSQNNENKAEHELDNSQVVVEELPFEAVNSRKIS